MKTVLVVLAIAGVLRLAFFVAGATRFVRVFTAPRRLQVIQSLAATAVLTAEHDGRLLKLDGKQKYERAVELLDESLRATGIRLKPEQLYMHIHATLASLEGVTV